MTFPSTVMSRDRVMAISSNLHMSDPAEDAVNDQKKGTGEYDGRPLLDIMRNRCMSVYHLKQHISANERIVATKARIAIKLYMKAKLIKWGLKFFVLADMTPFRQAPSSSVTWASRDLGPGKGVLMFQSP